MSETDKPGSEQSFVGRWSQRKQQRKSEQAQTHNPQQEQALAAPPEDNVLLRDDLTNSTAHPMVVPDSEIEQEEPLLTDADMPDIQTLTAESDVSPFLNRGVSTALRKAALSYIFSLPSYNVRDGLNDYDEDYTMGTWEPLGDIETCDMKFHADRKEKLRLEEERLERERLEAEAEDTVANESEEPAEQPSVDHDEVNENESMQNELPTDESNSHPNSESDSSSKVEHA